MRIKPTLSWYIVNKQSHYHWASRAATAGVLLSTWNRPHLPHCTRSTNEYVYVYHCLCVCVWGWGQMTSLESGQHQANGNSSSNSSKARHSFSLSAARAFWGSKNGNSPCNTHTYRTCANVCMYVYKCVLYKRYISMHVCVCVCVCV